MKNVDSIGKAPKPLRGKTAAGEKNDGGLEGVKGPGTVFNEERKVKLP